jgi:DNA-binding transcriptional LysR family regulator
MDRNLAAFLAVARSATLTDAASLLHVTQPSITKRIANLEGELGASLFERHRRGMSLTQAGAAFLRRAVRIEQEQRQAKEEIAAIASAGLSKLRVGAGPLFHLLYAAPLFARLKERFPKLSIDLIADANVRTIPLLLDHELDVVLGVLDQGHHDDLILTVPVTEVEHGIVLPADDPRSQQQAIDPSDLTDKMWVLYTEDPETERIISEHYLHRGQSAPDIDVRTSSFSTGLQLVRQQDFVMSAPIQLSEVIEKEGLVIRRVRDGMPKRQAGLHVRQSGANIAAIQYAMNVLPELVEGKTKPV